jgi:hypothetical protein
MFLHRVKLNWKKHQTLALTILLVAFARMVMDNVFGEAILSGYGILKIGLGVLAATMAWAFLKTCWELGTVYCRRLCTFVVALRKFCRDYWSKTAAV